MRRTPNTIQDSSPEPKEASASTAKGKTETRLIWLDECNSIDPSLIGTYSTGGNHLIYSTYLDNKTTADPNFYIDIHGNWVDNGQY